jgi:hypothetical protein
MLEQLAASPQSSPLIRLLSASARAVSTASEQPRRPNFGSALAPAHDADDADERDGTRAYADGSAPSDAPLHSSASVGARDASSEEPAAASRAPAPSDVPLDGPSMLASMERWHEAEGLRAQVFELTGQVFDLTRKLEVATSRMQETTRMYRTATRPRHAKRGCARHGRMAHCTRNRTHHSGAHRTRRGMRSPCSCVQRHGSCTCLRQHAHARLLSWC